MEAVMEPRRSTQKQRLSQAQCHLVHTLLSITKYRFATSTGLSAPHPHVQTNPIKWSMHAHNRDLRALLRRIGAEDLAGVNERHLTVVLVRVTAQTVKYVLHQVVQIWLLRVVGRAGSMCPATGRPCYMPIDINTYKSLERTRPKVTVHTCTHNGAHHA